MLPQKVLSSHTAGGVKAPAFDTVTYSTAVFKVSQCMVLKASWGRAEPKILTSFFRLRPLSKDGRSSAPE